MELATAQPNLRNGQSVGMAKHGDDAGLFVTFYTESVEAPFESEQRGYTVFKDVVYVHIMFPGNRSTEVRRPARLKAEGGHPADIQRWPRQWEAFQSQSVVTSVGMPVTEWAPLSKSQALMLKAMNIHTVEQLAEVPDHALTWLGARDMQVKAQTWLKSAANSAEALRLQADNDRLRADIDALKAQVAELAAPKKQPQRG